jgi:hypothetical protein
VDRDPRDAAVLSLDSGVARSGQVRAAPDVAALLRPSGGSSQTRSARGAPSQQFAFMWQCGQSQRVEIGSNGFPQ